jgi:hypothetical protein
VQATCRGRAHAECITLWTDGILLVMPLCELMKNRTCNHEELYALSTLSWAAQTSFLLARAMALFVKLAQRGWRIFYRKPVIRDVRGIGLMKLMP